MNLLEPYVTLLVGSKCSESLLKFELSNIPCLKLFISKVLGFGIVFGSGILKVPQILKIVSHQSVNGISLLSYVLETIAFMIVTSYNFRQGNPYSCFFKVYTVILNIIDSQRMEKELSF